MDRLCDKSFSMVSWHDLDLWHSLKSFLLKAKGLQFSVFAGFISLLKILHMIWLLFCTKEIGFALTHTHGNTHAILYGFDMELCFIRKVILLLLCRFQHIDRSCSCLYVGHSCNNTFWEKAVAAAVFFLMLTRKVYCVELTTKLKWKGCRF